MVHEESPVEYAPMSNEHGEQFWEYHIGLEKKTGKIARIAQR